MLLTVDAMYPVPVMDHSSDFSVIFPVRRIASGVSTDDATTNTLDITIGNVIVFATPSLGTSTSNTHCLDFADNYHVAVDVFGVTRNISIPMRVAAICFDIVGCNV